MIEIIIGFVIGIIFTIAGFLYALKGYQDDQQGNHKR